MLLCFDGPSAQLILAFWANPEACWIPDRNGRLPLHVASANHSAGAPELVSALLDVNHAAAQVSPRNFDGDGARKMRL
eukprot:2964944-Rhodomonas_salina.1